MMFKHHIYYISVIYVQQQNVLSFSSLLAVRRNDAAMGFLTVIVTFLALVVVIVFSSFSREY